MNVTPISPTTKKAIAIGATGAVLGAGISYAVQKQAIKNANAVANAKGLGKVAVFLKSIPKKITGIAVNLYASYKNGLNKIANSGKVSKMTTAKTSALTGLTFTALYLLKRAMHSKKQENNN